MDTLQKALLKHSQAAKLTFTADDIRWATPEIVANYRAQRLKCHTIADLGCGIGFQAFAFAKTCQKVYAVDIDKQKILRAKHNAEILGLKNIIFIYGDALDPLVINKLKDLDIVFCDPERAVTEEKRSLQQLSPPISELLASYLPLTKKIAFELPPQIQNFQLNGEQEYFSVDGELNRLTIYLNELKHADRSAVILPGSYRLHSDKTATLRKSASLHPFLYEIDPAVVKADLLAELSQATEAELYTREPLVLFTSSKKIKSHFFKNSFQAVQIPFKPKDILEALQKQNVGKVILRYNISPQQYWQERKKIESALKGSTTIHLFRVGNNAIIAEKIKSP